SILAFLASGAARARRSPKSPKSKGPPGTIDRGLALSAAAQIAKVGEPREESVAQTAARHAQRMEALVMNACPALSTRLDRRERWFVAGLLLVFVLLSVQYSFKVREDDHRDNRSAILRWRDQILEFDRGL